MTPALFDEYFAALFGNAPFPWQRRLYKRFIQNDFPPCNLPTGLGKTAVIPIWLLALATAPSVVPRRLVYVVNRRTVVDQASDEARKVSARLAELPELSDVLRGLSVICQPEESPLAISTMRGALAESSEWRSDPTRPAIVIGTVDLVGSRLLFQGYRAGFKSRPLHAGFLGQDSLIVHDEAHLEPAFQELLLKICAEQGRRCDQRPIRVMELSATSRQGGEPFELDADDQANAVIAQRLNAVKTIQLHPEVDEKKTADRIAELSLAHKDSGRTVLVFARTINELEKIRKKLPAGKTRILTGTMRGLERDRLIETPVVKRFLPNSEGEKADGTVYLVCTSAGEVGINLSADHMVCDLTPFDSMAQRFGRVNRFGDRTDTRIDIVHPETFDADQAYERSRQRTLDLLRSLDDNGSPAALGGLDPTARLDAFSPTPIILATSDILFDAWAMTTIRESLPGRPPVADWLHGLSGNDPPQTSVAWREEVERLNKDELIERFPPKDLLEDLPLKPHELLSDRTDRVHKELSALVTKENSTLPVWIISLNGDVKVTTMGELPKADDLNGRTVLLSPSLGGLTPEGTLSASAAPQALRYDVSSQPEYPHRARIWDDAEVPPGVRWVRTLNLKPEDEDPEESTRVLWRWYVEPRYSDDDGSKGSLAPQQLQPHLNQVGRLARDFAERLGLSPELVNVFALAGRWHDLGKHRKVWQRYIQNGEYPELVLAKSSGRISSRLVERYRHEFGSLLDLIGQPEFLALSEEGRDLLLHLVAAHHGRARPHFPEEEAGDPEHRDDVARDVAREVPRRFARLQRKYGRWGLAYLESLLRAADAWASANPETEGQP